MLLRVTGRPVHSASGDALGNVGRMNAQRLEPQLKMIKQSIQYLNYYLFTRCGFLL